MKLHAAAPTNFNVFTGYGEGYVLVNMKRYESSMVVMPDRVWTEWGATSFESLDEAHFAALVALECDVLLLGTGSRLRFPRPELTRPLAKAGRGLDVMDVPAACRTYNILLEEGRKVAAALLLP
jgi:uncharacterized protein